MQVEILDKHSLAQVPSVSGIEIVDGQVWAMGDDSSFLYRLDSQYQVTETVSLYRSRFGPGEKIPKKRKADLEGMTSFHWQGMPYILTTGSGSKPQREKGYLLGLDGTKQVTELDLSILYRFLSKEYGMEKINIEGITATDDSFFIAQRGNTSGDNYLFQFPIEPFLSYLLGQSTQLPQPNARLFQLGAMEAVQLGFGGLQSFTTNWLFAVVAAENTQSTYFDGQVVGSLIGLIDLSASKPAIELAVMQEHGQALREKAESLAILERVGSREAIVLIATDNDDQPSSIIRARVRF